MKDYTYRQLAFEEIDSATALAEKVFMEFEAPEYSQEGINSFLNFIYSQQFKDYFINSDNIFLGCFDGFKLVGIMAMRSESHVSLAFVDKDYHRRGIATKLFKLAFAKSKEKGVSEITLNSSPYAVPFYHFLGFYDLDTEQLTDGIRYIPMKYIIK